MDTVRLYYRDSYLKEFAARVLDVRPAQGHTEVILDRTAFHPEGGGQPSDLGLLGGLPVVGVVERGGEVIHRVQGPALDGEVAGQVDWERRFDFMQQHSGQHILSQAFERAIGVPTVSFHLGLDSSTIDLAVTSLVAEQVDAVEKLANGVVLENRPILVHLVEPSDLARFELRKATERTEKIRVVEVAEFDAIPCGGTHCRSTGEVGLVKVVRWERRGGNARVEFLCGGRALRDYQEKNRAVVGLAAALSVKDREVPEAVERLRRELSESRCRGEQLRDRLLDYEAKDLLRRAIAVGKAAVVSALLPGYGPEELKRLAARITSRPSRVALLAAGSEKAHLVFARSEDLDVDAGLLLRQVCAPLAGRGGGRPNLAQGGIPESDRAGAALEAALRELRSALAV